MKPSILVFAGSNREGSVNKKLAQQVATSATQLGFKADFLDLTEYPMPLYDGDLEEAQGIPETAQKLEAVIKDYDAVIIASPEYNGAFTPLLKNTIDWLSRVDMRFLQPKVLGLVSASPGPGGGSRSVALTRTWFESMQLTVVADAFTVPSAMGDFANSGLSEEQQAELELFLYSVANAVEEKLSVAV